MERAGTQDLAPLVMSVAGRGVGVVFIETKDWGAGRGALLGAAIGVIGGPIGILADGGVGALAAKLGDSGFKTISSSSSASRSGRTARPS